MKCLFVQKKEAPDGIFYYADVGSEAHGRPSFRLWVSEKLVTQDERGENIIQFPAKAIISQTSKGNWILKPSATHLTFSVGVSCGYRGDSSYELLRPTKTVISLPFEIWDSERGNLGISSYALVTIAVSDMPLKYKWKRTGRLYGSLPNGITIITADGSETVLEGIEDDEEIWK